MLERTMHPSDAAAVFRRQVLLFWPALGLAFAISLWRVLNQSLFDDCGWFVFAIGRMLDGGRLYVDIMEVNPPLFFWLMTPPIALARWTGGDPQLLYKLWTMLVVGASVAFSHALARRLLAEQGTAMLLTLAVAVALALYPSWDFGQREHISLVLAMPYILLQALRREGRDVPVWMAAVAGVMAGLGFSIKPYILAVPLMLEVWVQWGRWSLRRLLRAENLLVAATGAAYLAVVWLFVPAYFENLLPLALATYHEGHRISWQEFLTVFFLANPRLNLLAFLMAAAILFLVRRTSYPRALKTFLLTLLFAAAGYELSWLLQGTRWVYLAYPPMALVMTAALMAMACSLRSAPERRAILPAGRLAHAALAASVIVTLVLSFALKFVYAPYIESQRRSGVFTPDVRSFYVFSMRMVDAFPLANELGLKWASRYPYLWPLPAILKARQAGRMTPELERAEAFLQASVVEDLRRYRPDLILVSTSDDENFIDQAFDYLGYFAKAPGFAEVMRHYRLVKRTPFFAYYRRQDGAGDALPASLPSVRPRHRLQ